MIDDGGEAGKQYLPAWHYLAGYLKLEAGDYAAAVSELKQANRSGPLPPAAAGARLREGGGAGGGAEGLPVGAGLPPEQHRAGAGLPGGEEEARELTFRSWDAAVRGRTALPAVFARAVPRNPSRHRGLVPRPIAGTSFATPAGMDRLVQDLRVGVRLVARSPLFAVAVVVTLGLGIGANTAMFTVLDQVLLRPLPVRSPRSSSCSTARGRTPARSRCPRTSRRPSRTRSTATSGTARATSSPSWRASAAARTSRRTASPSASGRRS